MYTVEIYKRDRRTKSGERLVHKNDYKTTDRSMLEHTVRHTWLKSEGFRYVIHETMVMRRNVITGEEFEERYDTPYACSPRSETYWSS
jgi:hypothetical protein